MPRPKGKRARRRPAPQTPQPRRAGRLPDLDAVSLRVRQIAATAGVIAEAQEEPLSHALYLLEESLLAVEQDIELLRVQAWGGQARPADV